MVGRTCISITTFTFSTVFQRVCVCVLYEFTTHAKQTSFAENLSGVVELSFEGDGGTLSHLVCVSTSRPATSVRWELNDTVITDTTESTTVLDDPVTAQYTHTLPLTEREGGLYRCTINSYNAHQDKTLTDFAELEVEGTSSQF